MEKYIILTNAEFDIKVRINIKSISSYWQNSKGGSCVLFITGQSFNYKESVKEIDSKLIDIIYDDNNIGLKSIN